MRTRSALFVLASAIGGAAVSMAQAAIAASGPHGVVLSFGITRDLSEAVRSPDPNAPSGRSVFAESMEVAVETDTIEAKIGTSFGVRYSVQGLEPGQPVSLRKVVTFPPMHLPDGTVFRGYSKPLLPTVARSDGSVGNIQGYSFDEPFELVVGTWTIEIWLGDSLVASKDFHVVAPVAAKS